MISPSTIYLSSAYLPPVEYIHQLVKSDIVYIEANETYTKQTYRNRCEIYSANGKLALSIPVIKIKGNHTLTKDILISYHENWQNNHWRAIESAYNSSPFFLFFKDDLYPLFHKKINRLLEFNHELLIKILDLIGINKEIRVTDDFMRNIPLDQDFRFSISPKHVSKSINLPPYSQVFQEKSGYIPNLSIIDLLFNEGPGTLEYLRSINL